MHRRGHLSEKACGGDVIGCSKAMSMEVDTLRVEPRVEGRVLFQLPEGLRGVDADMKAESHGVTLVGRSVNVGDRRHILVDVVASRDVRFLGEGDPVGSLVDGENVVVGVDLLEVLEELAEKRLDGVRRGVSCRADSIDAEEDFMERGVVFVRVEEGGGRVENQGLEWEEGRWYRRWGRHRRRRPGWSSEGRGT